jgi:hypothetical protein
MTSLSIALFLIFLLYLIDKNNVWRQALKAVIGIAILGLIVIAGFYGWTKYDYWRKANVQQAAQQDHRRLVDACVTRYSTSGYAKSGPRSMSMYRQFASKTRTNSGTPSPMLTCGMEM